MDFTQLISDFADRHGIANLGAADNAAALDIDGVKARVCNLSPHGV